MDITNILNLLGTDNPIIVLLVAFLVLIFYLLAGHFGFRDPKMPVYPLDEKDVPDLFKKSEKDSADHDDGSDKPKETE